MPQSPHRSLFRNWRIAGDETVVVVSTRNPLYALNRVYTPTLNAEYVIRPKVAAYSVDSVDPTLQLTIYIQKATTTLRPEESDWSALEEVSPPQVPGGQTYYEVEVGRGTTWFRFAADNRKNVMAPLTLEVRSNTWAARFFDVGRRGLEEQADSQSIALKYDGKHRTKNAL